MSSRILLFLGLCLSLSLNAQWIQLGDAPFSRDHAIGFSLEGKGYLLTGAETQEFWEYSPDADNWKQLDNYPGPSRGFAIGDEWGGKYYFGFGSSPLEELSDLWVYDPSDNSFTQLPDCPCEARNHPAFIAHNDKIYTGTGSNFSSGNLGDWWEYDIITQQWSQKASIPGTRHHPFFFEIGDDIYVGGGHNPNWYRYRPADDSWTLIDSTPAGRVAGTQFNYNGKGYALSGHDTDHIIFSTGEFWEYDPIEDSWSQLPPHPGSSRWAPSSFVIEGSIYFVTGYGEDQHTTWRYYLGDPVSTNVTSTTGHQDLRLFPTPFNHTVNLQSNSHSDLSNSSFKVVNLLGQQIHHGMLTSNEVNLSFLKSGIYFISIKTAEGLLSQKIIKE